MRGLVDSYLLATNVFNRLVDSNIDPPSLRAKGKLYVMHVQGDELHATRNRERAGQLLKMFEAVEREQIPTAAAVWDVSKWNEAEWGDARGLYGVMLERLNRMNTNKANNAQDVLTALTALKRGLRLVTDDRDLTTVMREHGGSALSFDEFMALAVGAGG
jgi:hypothetical protein